MFPFFFETYKPKFDRYEIPHPSELGKTRDYDLLSPCKFYQILDSECRSYTNEASTIYVTGDRAKCDHWKRAFENCERWRKDSNDRESLENVLTVERSLFKMRQVDNVLNDVWKLRDDNNDSTTKKEPGNFNARLPWFLLKPGMDGYDDDRERMKSTFEKNTGGSGERKTSDFGEKKSTTSSGGIQKMTEEESLAKLFGGK